MRPLGSKCDLEVLLADHRGLPGVAPVEIYVSLREKEGGVPQSGQTRTESVYCVLLTPENGNGRLLNMTISEINVPRKVSEKGGRIDPQAVANRVPKI